MPQCWLSTIQIPDEPETIFWIDSHRFPAYWQSGTLTETQTILADWLATPFCLALAVPSVILEESYNRLLHPEYPAFTRVVVVAQRPINLDSRLRPSTPPI